MRGWRVVLELPVFLICVTAAVMVGAHAVPLTQAAKPTVVSGSTFEQSFDEASVRGFFEGYCATCHQAGRSGADFTDEMINLEAMRHDRSFWREVARRVSTREMPPRRFPQPLEEQRTALLAWLEKEVLNAPADETRPNLLVRRLQRTEYANTIRDLLGVQFKTGVDFPKDETLWRPVHAVGEMAPDLAKQYRSAAEKIVEEVLSKDLQASPGEVQGLLDWIAAMRQAACSGTLDADTKGPLIAFARRAYRKQFGVAEMEELNAILNHAEKHGRTSEEVLKLSMIEILSSPRFLTRVESNAEANTKRRVDPFILASRLSFLLWRSTPDAELLDLAETGTLSEHLGAQVKRMLADKRSGALAAEFANSWLSLEKLNAATHVDQPLRDAMRQETEMFVANVLREDRSVLEFLDADYTFLNHRLADHYGICGVQGDAMRRVALPTRERGGLVTHASVLTLTSSSSDTRPVSRGKWVLETLLNTPPIRPPAGLLQSLDNVPNSFGSGSVRQLLETHRANSSCAQCHEKMDAIGVSLENFDIAGIRKGSPADARGTLPGGQTLNDVRDLRTYLVSQREPFVNGLSEALLRFALSRKLDDQDRKALEGVHGRVAQHQYRFSQVILEVVQSEAFRR